MTGLHIVFLFFLLPRQGILQYNKAARGVYKGDAIFFVCLWGLITGLLTLC